MWPDSLLEQMKSIQEILKKKAYVVDSRIDMLKMASSMFYSENKDYR